MARVFPWPRPSGPDSAYQDDGPSGTVEFELHNIRFRVAPTNEVGIHTGRRRFLVTCLTCAEVLHEATTGPDWRIGMHLDAAHGSQA